MEAELYRHLRSFLLQLAHGRRTGIVFSDRLIVMVLLWAVLHDRPICWACDSRNWPAERDHELPSGSTMSRRLRSVGVHQLLERVLRALSDLFGEWLVKELDSKPLVVGGCSTDRDARRGRVAGGKARGYRLHLLGSKGIVGRWTLASMNVNDQLPAANLLAQLDGGGGYVVGDNGYDSNSLHRCAAAMNHQLIAPPRKSNRHVRDLRRNSPQRIRALELCHNPLFTCGVRQRFGRALLSHRVAVERTFSQLTFDGMHAPPPWVRRPHRMAVWVSAKLIIRHYKLAQKAGLVA